jgi:hypothetical protein
MKHLLIIGLLIVSAWWQSCSSNPSDTAESTLENSDTAATTVQPEPAPEPLKVIDPYWNNTARFLAGLPQPDSSLYTALEAMPAWQSHATEMEEIWQKASTLRLNALNEWTRTVLSPEIADTLPLFYPYSGPDFMHAFHFYPNAPAWHMIAIEKVVPLPDFTQMSNDQLAAYLGGLRTALRDVIGKSYFITVHMMKDLKSDQVGGVLPLFSVFLARSGMNILNVETIKLSESGQQVAETAAPHGLRFSLTQDGFTYRELTYMEYDLSDKNLEKHPEFMTWVTSLGPKNAFVKAASYLMHYKGFGISREATTSNTRSLFQDDTGIPLKYMDMNLWNVKLFGAYTRPIKDFSDMMIQQDLKALYEATPDSLIGTIPFPLGYHVVGDKIQNHQLFIRK